MNIAVHGVSFVNKGAELMLRAVADRIAREDAELQLSADLRAGTFARRRALGLRHYSWADSGKVPRLGPLIDRLASTLPATLRTRVGVVTDSDLDTVLDASGFAYSDQWGAGPAIRMAERSRRWRDQGTKLILLPQAMGPFRDPDNADAVSHLVERADLVFVRDATSLEHVRTLGFDAPKVRHAPDFTNLLPAIEEPRYAHLRGRACLVVNRRMLDKTSPEVQAQYVDFLRLCIERLRELGDRPFVLVHETRDDDLSHRIASANGLETVREDDPQILKGIIGASRLLIGSRFHALVSALSQGVPSLGTSWSHKYAMLFRDYGCEDFLIDIVGDGGAERARELLTTLLDDSEHSALQRRLMQAAEHQKEGATAMWEAVFSTIGRR